MRGDGWQLTVADEAALASMTRYSVVSWRQLSAACYRGVTRTTHRRLGYLREQGMVQVSRNDEWAGRVYMVLPAGVRTVRDSLRMPLSAPQQHPGERLLHRLAVTDAGLRFEELGRTVLTEREVRTAEASRADARALASSLGVPFRSIRDGANIERYFAVPIGAEGRVHFPDLVMASPQGLIAVEVEVSLKERPRMRQIIRGYRDSGLYHQVLYLTTTSVATLLTGYRGPDNEWSGGVLHELQLIPPGPPRPVSQTVQDRVRVLEFQPRDPGVLYRLDMRQLPQAWWVPKSRWEELRELWMADEAMGKAAGVPFLRWWQDHHEPDN